MPGPENLKELHYICPIANVPLIMKHGILSHKEAGRLEHASVADQEIQDRRERKRVPLGLPLHYYVNLYFSARNPMMYKRLAKSSELCVLRISVEVLSLPGVVITDGNASSDYTQFGAYPDMLERIDWRLVFAEDWRDANKISYLTKKRVKCAEVLVPKSVDPRFICGAYVSCEKAQLELKHIGFSLLIVVNPRLFFMG